MIVNGEGKDASCLALYRIHSLFSIHLLKNQQQCYAAKVQCKEELPCALWHASSFYPSAQKSQQQGSTQLRDPYLAGATD